MKILIINWQDIKNPLSGGAEVHLHEIFSRIVKMGNDVTLLCSSFKGTSSREIIDGIKVIRIGGRHNFNFYVPFVVQHLLDKNEYDMVIEDINKIPFFTPLYVTKKPVLIILHHFFGSSIYRETLLPFAFYVNITEKLVPFIYRKNVFAVASESTKDELIKNHVPNTNIHTIYNAISPNLYPDFEKKSPNPLIVIYGRIKKYKCPDICIRAMQIVTKQIPDAKLIIAGKGDFLPALVKLSKKLGIEDKVEFLGFISDEEKRNLLQSAWVGVNTSLKEGWGITIIEANTCGTPVVASNSPGLKDSVVNGKTGFLVEHGNIEKLAERIMQVLQNKDLRDTLSKNAVEWAKKFNWDTSANKMLKLIENTIENYARI